MAGRKKPGDTKNSRVGEAWDYDDVKKAWDKLKDNPPYDTPKDGTKVPNLIPIQDNESVGLGLFNLRLKNKQSLSELLENYRNGRIGIPASLTSRPEEERFEYAGIAFIVRVAYMESKPRIHTFATGITGYNEIVTLLNLNLSDNQIRDHQITEKGSTQQLKTIANRDGVSKIISIPSSTRVCTLENKVIYNIKPGEDIWLHGDEPVAIEANGCLFLVCAFYIDQLKDMLNCSE